MIREDARQFVVVQHSGEAIAAQQEGVTRLQGEGPLDVDFHFGIRS